MNPSVLNVLGHRIHNKLALAGNRIEIDLAGTLDELGDDNGVFLAHLRTRGVLQ